MKFDQAKTSLKTHYTDAELELIDEHRTELFFKYPKRESTLIRISEEEIL